MFVATVLWFAALSGAGAEPQETLLPPADGTPRLILDDGRISGAVTSLAYSPDGILHIGGFDKTIRRFDRNKPLEPIRLPQGSGNAGAINALAISPDGKWIAVGGRSPIRGESFASDDGLVVESSGLPTTLKRDIGVIHLIARGERGKNRVIRRMEAGIRALAFSQGDDPLLAAAGVEWDREGKMTGVVRVFDLEGKELGVRRDLPATPTRPGLGIVRDGKKIIVSVAWPSKDSGSLLIWELNGKEHRHEDGRGNLPLALTSGGVVSGGVQETGRLVLRDVRDGSEKKTFPLVRDGVTLFPLAVAGHGDDLLTLVQVAPAPKEHPGRAIELLLVGTKEGRYQSKYRFDPDQLPTLALSADGKQCAISGFVDHHVEIIDVATLRTGKPEVTLVPGGGDGFSRVHFLKEDKISVSSEREKLIFDPQARKVEADNGKQKVDDSGELPFQFESGKVTVTIENKDYRLSLRSGERPTSAARVRRKEGDLVAIAHRHEASATTLISLFELKSGQRVLELFGPSSPVRALSVSTTRPLIAAVAGDRTISVWSLHDSQVFAAIEGILFVEKEGKLHVLSVEDKSGVLKPGDRIEAAAGEKGEWIEVTRWRELLRITRSLAVGSQLRLKVTGAGVKKLTLGSGIARRNPLLNLRIDDAVEKWGWVGWSSSGPYDADGPASEAKLSWLTTTGEPSEPVRSAGIDQYRKLYYRQGIVHDLLATGDFATALRHNVTHHPRTPPLLAIHAEKSTLDRDGRTLVRIPPTELHLLLDDPDQVIRRDQMKIRIRAINSTGETGPWHEVSPDGHWKLANGPWSRGVHRFEAELRESPDLPPVLLATAAIRYLPAAPKATLVIDGKEVSGAEELVTAKATAEVTLKDASAGAEFTLRDGDTTISLKPESATTIPLKPKTCHRFLLEARNPGADDALETSQLSFALRHEPPTPKPAPRVRLTLLTPVVDGNVVASRTVQLRAEVDAKDPLAEVAWNLDGTGWKSLTPEEPGRLRHEWKCELPEGKLAKLTLRATVKEGESSDDTLSLIAAPLPVVEQLELPESTDSERLTLRWRVEKWEIPTTIRLERTYENGEIGTARELTVVDGQARAEVRLRGGVNRFRLVVKNAWREISLAPREVKRLLPPRILDVPTSRVGELGLGTITAIVVFPRGTSVEFLVVDGVPLAAIPVGKSRSFLGCEVRELRVEGVKFAAGKGVGATISVAAQGSEGTGRAQEARLAAAAPPPAPPTLTLSTGSRIIDEGAQLVVDRSTFRLSAQIDAATRPEVTIAREGDRDEVPVTLVRKVGDRWIAEATRNLELREGVNLIEFQTEASGAARKIRFTVAYTPPPIRVVVDALERLETEGVYHPLAKVESGRVSSPTPHLRVRGRVLWTDPAEAARASGSDIVLTANHVRHLPVELTQPKEGEKEAPFVAPLFLNGATTKVQIEVRRRETKVAQGAIADASLEVACDAPLPEQRLHVLVIAPEAGESARSSLALSVVDAVGGETKSTTFDRGPFQHRAFRDAALYRPLVYNVARANVIGLLRDVDADVRRLASRPGDKGYLNDVVVVYYQGRDLVGKDGVRRLHTTRSLQYTTGAAESHALRLDELPETPGVRLFLLNVTAQSPAQALSSTPFTPPPTLCYLWKDADSSGKLLSFYKSAVGNRRTLGDVIADVRSEVERTVASAERPLETIPAELRSRPIGAKMR